MIPFCQAIVKYRTKVPIRRPGVKEADMPQFLLLLLSLTSLAAPPPAVNGVKIVTRQVTGGFTDTRTEYLTEERLRNEWQTQMGDRQGPPMASIVQRGEHNRVFVLDLQAREYMTYETDSRGAALGGNGRPGRSMTNSGGTLQIWIENIDTGERKEMFGHMAMHIITREKRIAGPGACSRDSESETDGWYIDSSIMPEWRQPKKGTTGVVVASVMMAGNDNCLNKMDKLEVHRTGVEPGFPLMVSTTLKSELARGDGSQRGIVSTWGSQVVELKEGPLDPALFEVPGDFRRVEQLRTWIAAVAPKKQLSGWDWFKDKLEEWFR